MEHITQQSLAFDRADAFEQNEEAKILIEQEAKLLEEVSAFKDALVSAQSDLTEVQSKLRLVRKRFGVHKTNNQIIYEYVQQNPGKRFVDIVRYLEERGRASGNGAVTTAKDQGIIVENEYGTFTGGVRKKMPYGLISQSIIDYAKNNEWFGVKECFEYLNNLGIKTMRSAITRTIAVPYYKERFDFDKSGKFTKYRLKDQYRNM
jgi:hypothetical protein